jgi:hypothetical protein
LNRVAALWVLSLTLAACGSLGRTPGPSVTTRAWAAPTTAPPTAAAPTETPPPNCSLAYSDGDGSLFCFLDDGTSRLISAGAGLGNPRLSPDGALVAYRLTDGLGSQLWVVNADGSGRPYSLAAQDDLPSEDAALIYSPLNFAWRAGTHSLLFGTSWYRVGGEARPGERPSADLWTVNADSREVTQLLPQEDAGHFSLSPDGRLAAISRSTGMDLMDLESGVLQREVIAFPARVTDGEDTYQPNVTWSPDSQFFSVVIPASQADATWYRVNTDGEAQAVGTLAGVGLGNGISPEVSPDGQSVIYEQADPDGVRRLYLVRSDGSSVAVMDRRPLAQGWGWSPESQRYLFTIVGETGAEGEGLILGVEGGVEVLASGLNAVRLVRWRDPHSVLLHAQIEGQWGLWHVAPGGAPQLLVDGLGPEAQVDARP